MIIDFGRKPTTYDNILINDETVERVMCYKYLGTHIDSKLQWSENIDAICSKSKKRLYFLRKLKEFEVDHTILRLFFRSIIQSVLSFSFICWFGGLSKLLKNKLCSITKTADRIINDNSLCILEDEFQICSQKQFKRIMGNPSHPLRNCFTVLKSGVRLKSISARTNRLKLSYVGKTTSIINELPRDSRAELISLTSTVV
jgi:hypothetical protein